MFCQTLFFKKIKKGQKKKKNTAKKLFIYSNYSQQLPKIIFFLLSCQRIEFPVICVSISMTLSFCKNKGPLKSSAS